MARRGRKRTWAGSFQRTLGALTRATVRSGTRAVMKASAKALRPHAAKPRRGLREIPGDWVAGLAIGPGGARRYRLYKPPAAGASARMPLLVMLHGCNQDASAFARSTRLHRVAARAGFFVLYPEQDRLANAQGCWNWFESRSGRAQSEAALIVGAIDQVCTLYGADSARVAVAGLSAGASMAALLGTRYAARFKAVAMHSGVAPGMAHSTATALSAMRGRRKPGVPPVDAQGDLPPLLVIQGTADTIVHPDNARAVAQWWAQATGARPAAARTVQRGARHPLTVTDFKRAARTLVSLCEVRGLGHAWSGGAAGQAFSDAKGPDAARMIWAFAARQFSAIQSAAKQ